MAKAKPHPPIPPLEDWPLYWFAKLDKAVSEGDFQAAADAQRQLARLGVHVRYLPPSRSARGSEVAACR